ncbi:MAG: 30S ribosomal protein S13 [Gammaproteobacteria bacterium]|jgi:small subunit ribosomal protein S13
MIRVAGVILPHKKHIRIALLSIFGIGLTRAMEICRKIGVDPTTKVSDLTEQAVKAIQQIVSEFQVEGDLRRKVAMDLKRLKDIKCYRGIRHRRRLPVRGQRTRTNARTAKGRKRGS